MRPENRRAFNSVLDEQLVGLQLQVLAFAMPIDFSFAPERYIPGARASVWIRIESPFQLTTTKSTSLVTPGNYGPNVGEVIDLLWQVVEAAKVDGDDLLHLTFVGGTTIDILSADHVDWDFHDKDGGYWNVCGP